MTLEGGGNDAQNSYFNPHEREARDASTSILLGLLSYFNPHEREARDACRRFSACIVSNFNPHEREARD